MPPPQPAAAAVAAPVSPPPAPPAVVAPATASASHDLYLFAGLGAAALLLAALLLRRRRELVPAQGARGSAAASPTSRDAVPTLMPVPTQQATRGAAGGMAPATQQGRDAVDTATDPRVAEGTVVEEHKSAVELADIMMSFGRVQGAAETLAEFIRGNPREAVTPWLKLLEVYRAAGLRAEFDAIAGELNKTFNVSKVNWDNYQSLRASRMSLEELPHISETLQKSWRTTACQRYLQQLLRDNRDGTRVGFPFTVIDEVLTLSAILEEELGPCPRPDPGHNARR
jgi:LPXTG-motif cell wall-anchored protein